MPEPISDNTAYDLPADVSMANTSGNSNADTPDTASRRKSAKIGVTAFSKFLKENYSKVRSDHPQLSRQDARKLVGELWKMLEPEVKKTYFSDTNHDAEVPLNGTVKSDRWAIDQANVAAKQRSYADDTQRISPAPKKQKRSERSGPEGRNKDAASNQDTASDKPISEGTKVTENIDPASVLIRFSECNQKVERVDITCDGFTDLETQPDRIVSSAIPQIPTRRSSVTTRSKRLFEGNLMDGLQDANTVTTEPNTESEESLVNDGSQEKGTSDISIQLGAKRTKRTAYRLLEKTSGNRKVEMEVARNDLEKSQSLADMENIDVNSQSNEGDDQVDKINIFSLEFLEFMKKRDIQKKAVKNEINNLTTRTGHLNKLISQCNLSEMKNELESLERMHSDCTEWIKEKWKMMDAVLRRHRIHDVTIRKQDDHSDVMDLTEVIDALRSVNLSRTAKQKIQRIFQLEKMNLDNRKEAD